MIVKISQETNPELQEKDQRILKSGAGMSGRKPKTRYTVKNLLGKIPQNVSNANYTKISEFFPKYVGEYFLKIGNFPKLLWKLPPDIFGEYSPKIRNFPKYLGNFF